MEMSSDLTLHFFEYISMSTSFNVGEKVISQGSPYICPTRFHAGNLITW